MGLASCERVTHDKFLSRYYDIHFMHFPGILSEETFETSNEGTNDHEHVTCESDTQASASPTSRENEDSVLHSNAAVVSMDDANTPFEGPYSCGMMSTSLCRLCATEGNEMVPIFGVEGMRLRLAYKINKQLPFTVSPRSILPLEVCHDCIKQLDNTMQFVRKCLISQAKLKSALKISEEDWDDPIQSSEKSTIPQASENAWNTKDVSQPSQVDVDTEETFLLTPEDNSGSIDVRGQLKKIKLKVDDIHKKYHAINIPSEELHNTESCEITIELPSSKSGPACEESDGGSTRESFNKNELTTEEVNNKEVSAIKPIGNLENVHKKVTGDLKHICSFCSEGFTWKAQLFHHQTEMHPDSVFRCKFCLKVFYDKEELDSHELAHQRRLPSGHKGKVYLNHHLKAANRPNDLRDSKEKLLSHVPTSSKSINSAINESCGDLPVASNDPDTVLQKGNEDENERKCISCNIEFDTVKKKRRHMRDTHKILLPCRFCPRTFKYGFELKRHEGFHWKRNNKELVCKICKKCCTSTDILKEHELIHMHVDGYKCEVCFEEFSQGKEFEEHIQTHAGKSSYLCETCGQNFEEFMVFRVHKMTHMYGDYHECEVCKKPFFGSKNLEYHLQEKHPYRDDNKLACKVCHETFSTIELLKEHKAVHDRLGYECDICGKTFGSLKKLRNHKQTHSVEKNYLCEKCGKGFKSNATLHKHRYLCQVAIACNVCNREFDSNTRLRVHMRVHTGEKPFVCSICGKGFHASWSLNQHSVTHNLVKIPCPLCGALFNRKSNMLTHKKRHRVPCEKCGQVFPNTPSLLAHQQTMHLICENDGSNSGGGIGEGETANEESVTEAVTSSTENNNDLAFTALKCEECGKFFVTNLDLKAHMMSHSDARPYKCNICGKSWRLKKTLQNHMITHSGRMPYQCRYCTCTFLLHQSLLRHEKGHTAGKPYNCSDCGQSFWTQLSLEKHSIRHSLAHSQTAEMKYPCNFCDKVFGRKSTLFIHKRIHSSQLNIGCKYCPRKFSQLRFLRRHKCAFNPSTQVSNSTLQEGFLTSLSLLTEEANNVGKNTSSDAVLNEEVVYDMDSSTPYAEIIVISQSMDELIV